MNIAGALLCTIASAALVACTAQLASDTGADPAIRIGATDIGGVVTGPGGPEAGVWVIAETTGLPTRYAKMVVTDDRGRYVLPGLPKAAYSVWVRGYGLVDSPKVAAEPGKLLNLTAVPAPSEAAAAQYYPAIYWYSMLDHPARERVRRAHAHSEGAHADRLAEAGEEHRLHRLPPARPGLDAQHPRHVQVHELGRGVDAPAPGRAVRRADDDAAGREFRRGALQVLRRLDRPHREGRAAVRQAAAPAGRRAQRRDHLLGMEHARSTTCTT